MRILEKLVPAVQGRTVTMLRLVPPAMSSLTLATRYDIAASAE